MINDVLVLLKNQLNSYFASLSLDGSAADFPAINPATSQFTLKPGKVNLLLYRIEKDPSMGQRGTPSCPTMNINLNVLFVVTVTDYQTSLEYLSQTIQFFQTHRSFNPQNAPDMSASLGELTVDIITFDLDDQSALWLMLAGSYLPSVAYQVKAVVFGGSAPNIPSTPINTIDLQVQVQP